MPQPLGEVRLVETDREGEKNGERRRREVVDDDQRLLEAGRLEEGEAIGRGVRAGAVSAAGPELVNAGRASGDDGRPTAEPCWKRGRIGVTWPGSLATARRREPKQGGNPWPRASTKSSSSWGRARNSWERAASAAVERAAETLRDLRVAEVVEQDIAIKDGKVEAYRVKMKLSFKYEKADD